jgi:hypothetical protein
MIGVGMCDIVQIGCQSGMGKKKGKEMQFGDQRVPRRKRE